MYHNYKAILQVTLNSTSLKQVIKGFATKQSFIENTLQFKSNLKSSKFIPNVQVPPRFLTNSTHDSITSIQMKKRPLRKKKSLEDETSTRGVYNVVAYATSEEYNLEGLIQGLKEQDLYEPQAIPNESNVVHALAKYSVGKEPREIFFFREGGVVLWNITDLESSNVLSFLRKYEEDSYSQRLVNAESEIMNYRYHTNEGEQSCLDKEGSFVLQRPLENENLTLVKYTFSNVMFLSVKLSIWEASLEKYIEEIEDVTEDLKRGKKINMTRHEALRKHGELFALRHYVNLSSDVLDTPDFYWENEKLESLYNEVCVYFGINKRTKVMNEKLNHCVALIELLSHHLDDKHHVRLEWMIIVLIMVEVVFEVIHYVDRYMH